MEEQVGSRVLGVLGGRDLARSAIAHWAAEADLVLAADGGADRLREAAARADVLIGDLDSASAEAQAEAGEVVHQPEQDSTDCDKLLAYAEARGFGEVTLIGLEGDRLDHVLSTLHSAARARVSVRFGLRRGIGWLLRGPARLARPGERGARLSVLPLTRCEGVTIHGVAWPVMDAEMEPTGFTSVSNRLEADSFAVSLTRGVAVAVLQTDGAPRWD